MVGGLLTTLGVGVVLWLLTRSSARAPDVRPDGAVVLAYPPLLRRVGIGLAAMCLTLVGFLGASLPLDSASDFLALAALLGVMAALVAPFFLEAGRVVTLSARGLEGRYPGRQPVTLGWSEVASVRYVWTGYLQLAAADGRKINVSPYMRGSEVLADLVEERLTRPGVEEALVRFRAARAGYELGGRAAR